MDRASRTHDYTHPVWGHDVSITTVRSNGILDVCGWGHGVREGDFLIVSHGDGTTRYQVVWITYYDDPPDMWKAELVFAPRTAAVGV